MHSIGRIAGLLLGLCLATATLAQKPSDEEFENSVQILITNSTTLGPG